VKFKIISIFSPKVTNLPLLPTLSIMPPADTSPYKQVASYKPSCNLTSLYNFYYNIIEWSNSQLQVMLKSTWHISEQLQGHLFSVCSDPCQQFAFWLLKSQRISFDQNLSSYFRKHLMSAKGTIFITVCCLTALDGDQIYCTYKRQGNSGGWAKNFEFLKN
jgi:hypothetical protein